jgi:hypothetical protein
MSNALCERSRGVEVGCESGTNAGAECGVMSGTACLEVSILERDSHETVRCKELPVADSDEIE